MQDLTIGKMQSVEQLEQALGQLRAGRGKDLCLDLSETPKLSTSAMQLLISARKTWAADGKALSLRGLGADARDTLALVGLADEFEIVAEAQA